MDPTKSQDGPNQKTSRILASEVMVIKETDSEMKLEIVGEGHTFCNALVHVLNTNESVLHASYRIEHPLVSNPVIYLKIMDSKIPSKTTVKRVPLTDVKGIGPAKEKQLKEAGIKTANSLIKADLEKLSEKSKLSKSNLEKYVAAAGDLDMGGESMPRSLLKESLNEMAKMFSLIKKAS